MYGFEIFFEFFRYFYSLTIHSDAIRYSPKYRVPDFFAKQDRLNEGLETTRPIYFSPAVRQMTLNMDGLGRVVPSNGIIDKKYTSANLIEFCLHQYGHIATLNDTIRLDRTDSSLIKELERDRYDLSKIFDHGMQHENYQMYLKKMLRHLSSEVFRRDIDIPTNQQGGIRNPQSYSQHASEIVVKNLHNSELCSVKSIMRAAVWYPICKHFGPQGSDKNIINALKDQCNTFTPKLNCLPAMFCEYFEDYYKSHYFDKEAFMKISSGS